MANNQVKPIRLLNIQSFVNENLMKIVDFEQIIFISKLSTRARDLIRRETVQSNGVKIDVTIDEKTTVIIRDGVRLFFKLVIFDVPHSPNTHTNRTYNINGTPWPMKRQGEPINEWIHPVLLDEHEQHLISFVALCKTLFNAEIGNLVIGKVCNFQLLFDSTDIFRRADKIEITALSRLFFMNNPIRFPLFHCEAEEFDCPVYAPQENTNHNEVNISQPLRFSKITTTQWFNEGYDESWFENIGICKTLDLSDSDSLEENINDFIKDWYQSVNQTFEHLQLTPCWTNEKDDEDTEDSDKDDEDPDEDDNSEYNIRKLTAGLPFTPGYKKRTELTNHLADEWDFETGSDIRRDDGVLATLVTVKENRIEGIKARLLFIVWKDFNPNAIEV